MLRSHGPISLIPRETRFFDEFVALSEQVKQLEHEADRCHQDAIVALFEPETDPIVVIKWKETFDFLEAATDRCEDVANLLEGVIVKNG